MVRVPWRRRRTAFSRLKSQDLDLLMLPPYTTPAAEQAQQRQRVEQLVNEAGQESFDAGTREFLNNHINALADQAVAELILQRDDAIAVADAYIALAAEQVGHFQPPYEADLVRMAQAANALTVTYEELTGHKPDEYVPPSPRRPIDGPVRSTLGPIDISDEAETALDEDGLPVAPASAVLADIPDPFADPDVEDPAEPPTTPLLARRNAITDRRSGHDER
jgi:hypothetical protein